MKVGLIHRTPRRPEGGGKIEALIGTLQEELFPELKNAAVTSIDELNAILAEWAFGYNRRLHTETHMAPLDRWNANLEHVRPIDPARLAEAFWWVKTPRVTKMGIVAVHGCEYEVDLALVGQTIAARFNPFDATGTIRVVDAAGKLWGAYQPRTAFPADNGRGRGTGAPSERPPLASARTYIERMAATGRGRAAPIPVNPSETTAPELAAAHKLVHLVASYLLKPDLTPAERQAVVACCHELVVVRFELAEAALAKVVHRAGRDRHITRYTAAIIEAHRLEAHS